MFHSRLSESQILQNNHCFTNLYKNNDSEVHVVTMCWAHIPDVEEKKHIQNFNEGTSWKEATWKIKWRWEDNHMTYLREVVYEDGR